MPLIPQQHILTSTRLNSDDAIQDLREQMDKLPPVKIVSVASRDISVFNGKAHGIELIAVVEEA